MPTKQISLYYKDGSSDKVYHAQIEEKETNFVVNFQYGRRDGNLKAGTKTNASVSLSDATTIFNNLVQEKTSKGYTEGVSGAIFQSKNLIDRVTGIVPQLLNTISLEEVEQYMLDNDFVMQEKKDGERILIKVENGIATAINKKGLETLIPQSVVDSIIAIKRDIVVDGELLKGEKYCPFDILALDGKDLKVLPYKERYGTLAFFKLKNMVACAFTCVEKKKLFKQLEDGKKEGSYSKELALNMWQEGQHLVAML